MCGIAGFLGKGDERTLTAMTRTLTHRGPDDEGYFFDPADSVGLGFRRLSIIDIQGGFQPMFNEEKTVALIFNGEIYNFQKLRKQLEPFHRFQSRSDTEVIVHLYEEKGEAFLEALEGMFALALWDARAKKLIIARDRFGEKPLYWAQRPGVFLFGSEPKALFAHPALEKKLSEESLFKYLFYEYVPSPHTIFSGVSKLEPGHVAIVRNGEISVTRYWDILDHCPQNPSSMQETLSLLENKLDRAVSSRLLADVPLGVFLSGGIDSSTVAFFAARHASHRLRTFSIGFEESSYDESAIAREVARRIGTDHHEELFGKRQFLEALPALVAMVDEPLADPSLLPTWFLSKTARASVTVALGGDGGDELFLGYPTFIAEKFWRWYQWIPSFIRAGIRRGVPLLLPVSHRYFSFDFKCKKFLEGEKEKEPLLRNQRWLSAFLPESYRSLLAPSAQTKFSPITLTEDIATHRARASHLSSLHQINYLYLKHYLADDILTKVDRASMLNSLEVRSPFLDTDLAQWVFALPPSFKLRGRQTKYILKRLMAPYIGEDIVSRKKQGFTLPLAAWLASDLLPLVKEYCDPSRIEKEGIFNPSAVTNLIEEHEAKKVNHQKKIWTLLLFQMWKAHHRV